MSCGIVTIATGRKSYKQMAHDLALSVRRFSPGATR
ncbi:hypothetical protein Pla108_34420 [Botrimarina colliarenosi]|uniref:Uncharacterized protein n=1 Tax=Botrimarina colliarenosi TaxID=2528001 RepID=A0A5C6A7E3_9BACT|nr:hypothetical protein Pla108_34420 [Botrimarina colliarenosi]